MKIKSLRQKSFFFNRTMTFLMIIIILIIAAAVTDFVRQIYAFRSGEKFYGKLRDSYFSAEKSDVLPAYVNFRCRSRVNRDIIGWLFCPDTGINYPVMYSDKNIYAGLLPDKERNISGSLYIDKSCSSDLSSFNTVIFGKSQNRNVMFGSLNRYRRQEYYEAHPCMYLLTPEHDYRIDIFSAYLTERDEGPYESDPGNEKRKKRFIKTLYERSGIISDVTTDKINRIITLSTFVRSGEAEAFVVHGNLVKLD